MDSLQLIKLHLELECIGFDPRGDLIRIPGPDPDDVPRVYIAQHRQGYVACYRHDLPSEIRHALQALPVRRCFTDYALVQHILATMARCESLHVGKSYVFPMPINSSRYPAVTRLDETHTAVVAHFDPDIIIPLRAVYGVIVEGELAAVCMSSRENHHSGEAWVYTTLKYRRHGYARQVTLAWAASLLRQGKTPFYSHTLENQASASLARSLGLHQYVADVGYN
jgi:GNAT acetyltransferase